MKGLNSMNLTHLLNMSIIESLKFQPVQLQNRSIGGGIYRMYDNSNIVIYVGKSQNLVRRLHQHIGEDTNSAYFINEAIYFEWLPESSPLYQNLLEAIFIAYHEPKYNDEVKDTYKEV